MPKVTEKKNKRGQQKPALSKCTANEAQEKNTAGGRGIKRCRSSSLDEHHHHHQQQQQNQNQVREKSLCLVLTDTHDGCDSVYVVKLDGDNDFQERNFCKNCSVELFGVKNPEPFVVSGFREITPSSSSKTNPYGEMFASLSSRVYVLGALGAETDDLVSRKVFYFDTNHEEEGWKRGPDMLMARDFNGKAVSLDGKIYVLGGLDDSEREPFGEVFDLVKNEWEPLTPLPDYVDRDAYIYGPVVTYGLEGDKKIVIGNSCSGTGRFVYHVKSGTWEGFEPEISYPEIGKALGVGNVIYWIDAGKLQAINMNNGKRYRARIKGSELRVQLECLECFHTPEPELFHLGGKKFCFFTLRAIRGGRTKVRCSKFEVSKCLRPPSPSDTHSYGCLKAAVNSRVTFVLDRPLNSFNVLGLLVDGIPNVVLNAMEFSEKLDSIVQIIKKRSSALSQRDDEIEVDIDNVDAETLWELDRFVTNYKKCLSKNKRKAELALQRRAEATPAGPPMILIAIVHLQMDQMQGIRLGLDWIS